jgi:non-ribosomal peptide synthetase component F
LYRYSGDEEIVVATPVSGRSHTSLEAQIGAFINTLVFKTRLSAEDTFLAVLQRVKDNVLEGLKYQDYPFDLLMSRLQAAHAATRLNLFEVGFTYHEDFSRDYLVETDLDIDRVEAHSKAAQTSMWFHASEQAGRLGITLTYNRRLCGNTNMVSLLNRLGMLLEQVAGNEHAGIVDLSLDPHGATRKEVHTLQIDLNL